MAASNTRYLPDVALLAVATFYIIRAVHPPHFAAASDRVDAKKKAQKDGDREEGSGDVLSSMGFTSLTPVPIQAAFILASLWSTKALLSGKAWRDVSAGSAGPPVSWRLLFAFGNILTMLGGIARLRCYRELGKFFTFDLAVQKGQKHACRSSTRDSTPTSGIHPTHPSYTSILMSFYGAGISHFMANPAGSLRGWSIERLGALVVLHTATWTYLISRRITDEEKMMRREMGQAYEDYAKRVPYRLFPGIW